MDRSNNRHTLPPLQEQRITPGLHSAAMQDHDGVPQEIRLLQIVGRENDDTVFLELGDYVPDLSARKRVKTGGWLCLGTTATIMTNVDKNHNFSTQEKAHCKQENC